MNTLTESQQKALSQGLVAFDAAAPRRRAVRRLTRGTVAGALVVACVVLAGRAIRTPLDPLPAYLEIIAEDSDLAGELEVANACERIDREDGRLLVIECTLPPRSGS